MPDSIRQQVEINYKAFQEKLSSILTMFPRKFALMRDGQIIEFFDAARHAYVAGQRIFQQDQLFPFKKLLKHLQIWGSSPTPCLSGRFDYSIGPPINIGVIPAGVFTPSFSGHIATFPALIDMGASVTCISQSVVQAVGV